MCRWLSERYPLINQPGGTTVIPIIDNFYLDMNGIIHNCTHGAGREWERNESRWDGQLLGWRVGQCGGSGWSQLCRRMECTQSKVTSWLRGRQGQIAVQQASGDGALAHSPKLKAPLRRPHTLRQATTRM